MSLETENLELKVAVAQNAIVALRSYITRLEQRIAWLEEITGKRSLHVSRSYTLEEINAAEKGSEAGEQGLQIEHQG